MKSRLIAAPALLAIVALAAPAVAQDYASGQEAYTMRDWAAAQDIWTREAEEGAAAALLGLGNLLDFGLTGPADPEGAFILYERAARLGNAEAAFNVAVMQDSGIGTALDRQAAAGWYSLAALGAFPRAEYNLGLMYDSGEGVPQNAPLARYWLDAAADEVPAARTLVQAVEGGPGETVAAPQPLAALLIEDEDGAELRLAWAAPPGPEGTRYHVEVVDGAAAIAVAGGETVASAAAFDLPLDPGALAWRVSQVAGEDYASSGWHDAAGLPVDLQVLARVRFETAAGDRRALGYAERMGASFERSGVVVTHVEVDAPLDGSAVSYAYDSDSPIAERVAAFLPSLGSDGAERDPEAGLAPGEVLVRIAFD